MMERCVSVEIFLECRQKNNRRSQLFKATWHKVEHGRKLRDKRCVADWGRDDDALSFPPCLCTTPGRKEQAKKEGRKIARKQGRQQYYSPSI